MLVQISTDLFISVHNPKPNQIKILSHGSRGLNLGGLIEEVAVAIDALSFKEEAM